MIATETIREIQRLLERGELSQRKIARRLGVSRGTVNSVANGTHAQRNARRARRFERFDPPQGPPRRCTSCGRLVQMPCLACWLQRLVARQNATWRDRRGKP